VEAAEITLGLQDERCVDFTLFLNPRKEISARGTLFLVEAVSPV